MSQTSARSSSAQKPGTFFRNSLTPEWEIWFLKPDGSTRNQEGFDLLIRFSEPLAEGQGCISQNDELQSRVLLHQLFQPGGGNDKDLRMAEGKHIGGAPLSIEECDFPEDVSDAKFVEQVALSGFHSRPSRRDDHDVLAFVPLGHDRFASLELKNLADVLHGIDIPKSCPAKKVSVGKKERIHFRRC
jgi:hypothetical protein